MSSGLGTIGEGGADVVDNRGFGRADEPRWSDDDLDDVQGSADALVEVYPEIGGEGVEDHAAAIDPLQQQDLLYVRMGSVEGPWASTERPETTTQPASTAHENLLETLGIRPVLPRRASLTGCRGSRCDAG